MTDKRYRGTRWRKTVRPLILARDKEQCFVLGCPRRGNVVDHINPVYPGMPDREFYDERNLRASCHKHNTTRGMVANYEREIRDGVAIHVHNPLVNRRRSLTARVYNNSPLAKSTHTSPHPVITGDYSRRSRANGAD